MPLYPSQPVIELEHVSRRLPNGKICPDDVSLELYPGQLTLITGGNGAGKSTLMNILSLLDKPTQGKIIMLGHDVQKLNSRELGNLQEHIEYIPQKLFGLQKGSALWNVQHLLEYEMNTNDAKKAALEALKQVQTPRGFDIHKDVSKLSGGEKGRIAIAVALARQRPICLADEIFADVDVNSHIPLTRLFRQMAQSGICVVMIAHIPGLDAYFDRVITLENYRVKSDDVHVLPGTALRTYQGHHTPNYDRLQVPVPPQPVVNPRVSRRRALQLGIGAGVTAAGAGVIYWLERSRNSILQSTPKIGGTQTGTARPTTLALPGTTLYTYRGHSDFVNTVAWSTDGKYIASGSQDHTTQVWEALTGNRIIDYTGQSNAVYSIAWSPDGKYIVSGANDKTVQVWEALTGIRVADYVGHPRVVDAVAWSTDGKYIVTGSDNDSTVQVWEAFTGKHTTNYSGHSFLVNSVAWSPVGQYIASGSSDKTVQIWDAFSGKQITDYTGHSDMVFCVAWSPDGRLIVSGSNDDTVQVWVAQTGNEVLTYHRHNNMVTSVAWSPDGKYIASGSSDQTVQVWEAATGNRITVYTGHSSNVYSVAWSPDGKYIASGSVDKTVQVWVAPQRSFP